MTSTLSKVNIKEIFASIQGEGPYIGYKQLFIRFCKCNLNCKYCDTDFIAENSSSYSVQELVNEVNRNLDCHSVSLTGGEPLLSTNFLKEFLPECPLPVYLETNATLYNELKQITNYIDFIAADIKLPSCTGLKPYWKEHDLFFKEAAAKKVFAKIVFDKNITDEEIELSAELGNKYNIELILQPKNTETFVKPDMVFVNQLLDKFLKIHKKVRVIPQVHKILEVR